MIRFLSLFFLIIPFFLPAKEKICLNMIVKNEKDVIARCLDSVKGVIDYWVIVDTGSNDGTQKIIKKHLKGIPGELHERKWRNFGENRSEAFQLAKGKGDYILFMDADDILEFKGAAGFPPLTADLYNMWRGTKGFTYLKPQLAKGNLPWKWVGVTHEYLSCDQPYSSEILETVNYITRDGGASAKDIKKKFTRNVELLEEGLKKEPKNERYAFYLAESYKDLGEKGKALEWYQKRVNMGGWAEETFCAMMQIGHMLRDLGLPSNIVAEAYQNAFRFRPHRAEPIYYLAALYNSEENYGLAYEYLKARDFLAKPPQKDSLFNEDWAEDYGLLFQLSICSYYLGHHEESLKACDRLLTIKDLPDSWRKQAMANREFPLAKLKSESAKSNQPLNKDGQNKIAK